ncbi:hypothetical protein Pla108_39870 [Botrimarina colliarenosi]|uniref:mannan endo-1,4-beta-mannosidase n=1 Tax=Botrimarina colliarenosi TaxID=2528001 RepID=A0A5C6A0K4_9BACT|nr:cellulase family glycosylhydrolase [Botrimarina colliarenosi]TWT92847.1 hypothetical protein Pla108_39870 [Botrimarina colliarenosi]
MRSFTRLTYAFLLFASTWTMMAPLTASAAEDPIPFVTARGDRLFEGDQPLRFVSFNIPNLHLVEDAIEFLGESPWRWPNAFEIEDALDTIRQMNGRVVRTYVLSVRRESSDMGDCVHVTAPGEFNEAAFVALDRVLQIAGEKGVRVILPLVDNWHWWGGAEQYAAWRGKPAEAFWTNRQVINDFKRTIAYVVNRRNTLTGRLYRDDPTILGWETGNEISPTPAWTREIAAYLKSLDPNHLVIDGKSLDGVVSESLDDPNVDVITSHHYPDRGEDVPAAIAKAIRQTAGKKPYFVGEVGFLPTEEIAAIVDKAAGSHCAGVLLWSLRPHRREGGFYWHSEPMAKGRYKAYHWPGFPSGDGYDESDLLRLARESSFRMLGEPVTPLPTPSAPRLLPIDDPAAVSWQGSTGASRYKIQRASAKEGPWQTVAKNVSDAAIPYRPLWSDTDAAIGSSSYYRVIAGNAAGESAPSNVVGPVTQRESLVIDEFKNLDLVATVQGDATLVSDNPRAVQEDRNRLLLTPGASVTYEAPGMVTNVIVFAFSADDTAPEIDLESPDGTSQPSSDYQTDSPRRPAGDYGYLRPTRVTARYDSSSGSRVTITAPSGNIQIGRVEIRCANR